MQSRRLQSTPLNILPNEISEVLTFQSDHNVRLHTARYFFFWVSTTCCSSSSCKLVTILLASSCYHFPREMIIQ